MAMNKRTSVDLWKRTCTIWTLISIRIISLCAEIKWITVRSWERFGYHQSDIFTCKTASTKGLTSNEKCLSMHWKSSTPAKWHQLSNANIRRVFQKALNNRKVVEIPVDGNSTGRLFCVNSQFCLLLKYPRSKDPYTDFRMDFHGFQWISKRFDGYPSVLMDIHRSMDIHGYYT